ncbi:MAG: Gldg family protein, partial [Chroococcidiopsidaceae cyanobacterium CP_BM_ER_R8_30]|nr:Gldg family protein [Chroococcidiopsidaceae cyanobacterium CP_BM_ER_R8_30]
MKTLTTKKLWKYLFWVGPFLIVMGSSAAVVSGSWGLVPSGLLIGGIVLTSLWLLFQGRKSSWWKRRSTQAGTNALIATLSVLVILALLNFLGARYPVRVDLTENQLLTLAPESQQLIRQLHQPVKALVFDHTPNPQDRELLLNYQRQGPEFHFEYVDPQAQPELAEKFGVKQSGEVYLEANGKRKFVQVVSPQD